MLCPNCSARSIPGARFCHRCGDKLSTRVKPCPSCHGKNPFASVFCHHCGFHFEGHPGTENTYVPRYPLVFDHGDVTEQINALFFRSLRRRVGEEFDAALHSAFVERFYRSRFREVYAVRAAQIAGEATRHWERLGRMGLPELDNRLDAAFDGLLDYFAIQYCPDLGGIHLPEAILQYERAERSTTDLGAMLADFLAFHREKVTVYTNFVAIAPELLENACRAFLSAGRDEKLFFICDLSAKRNAREGFAMTDRALYWRAPFDRSRVVTYDQLADIQKKRDHLVINGHFFSAGPSLDLKVYKLLKKLRNWYVLQAD